MDRISDDELNTLINHYYHQDKTKSALTELRERRDADKARLAKLTSELERELALREAAAGREK